MALPQPHAEAVVTEAGLAALLLASLAAFGISVTALAGAEEVGPWVVQQFQEYVESVGDNLSTVWSRIKYGVSKLGELVMNGFALRYNARFGEWLVNKFTLTDNSTVIYSHSSEYHFGVSSYPVPFSYTNIRTVSSSKTPAYVAWYRDTSVTQDAIHPVVFSLSQGSYAVVIRSEIDTLTTPMSSCVNSVYYNPSFTFDRSVGGTLRFYTNDYQVLNVYPNLHIYNSLSEIVSLFNVDSGHVIPSSVTLGAGTISVPDTSDYGDDDAIVIGGLGETGSSLDDVLEAIDNLTVPASTTVTNNYITYTIVPETDVADTIVPDTIVIDPVTLPLPVVVQGEVLTVLGGGSVTIINGAQDAIPVYLPGGITVTWPVEGIPIEWPTNGIPVTWPSGGIPIDWPSGGIPVTWPSGGIPIQWPSGGIPLDVPAGGIPVSLPSGGIPVTWPSGGIPIDWPSSGIPVDLPAGGIPVDWPVDGIPVTWPSDGIPIDWDDAPTLSVELPDTLVGDFIDEGILTTENSPGYFNGLPLISGIPDFGFGDLWHYVTDWLNSMSAGLSLISGVMFSLPFVSAFYAFVVILIVLSLWRLLRNA